MNKRLSLQIKIHLNKTAYHLFLQLSNALSSSTWDMKSVLNKGMVSNTQKANISFKTYLFCHNLPVRINMCDPLRAMNYIKHSTKKCEKLQVFTGIINVISIKFSTRTLYKTIHNV